MAVTAKSSWVVPDEEALSGKSWDEVTDGTSGVESTVRTSEAKVTSRTSAAEVSGGKSGIEVSDGGSWTCAAVRKLGTEASGVKSRFGVARATSGIDVTSGTSGAGVTDGRSQLFVGGAGRSVGSAGANSCGWNTSRSVGNIPVLRNPFAAVWAVAALRYALPKISATWKVVTTRPGLFLSHFSSSWS